MSGEWILRSDLYYLNHAAVSPWPARTAKAIDQFARENAFQGSLSYPAWIKKEAHLKSQLRDLINASSVNEIALLKNTSEGLSVIAHGLPWKAGDNVVITSTEFPSNRIVWESLKSYGVEVRYADIHGKNPEQTIVELCDRQTRLLSVSSVQYASGLQLDLNLLGQHCKQQGILFCIDAIQSIGAVRFDVQASQADFVVADGHKWMMAPEGLALFYCRKERIDQLQLHQFGWHMVENIGDYDDTSWKPAPTARRFEAGSPNMLGVHALSASLSLIEEIGQQQIEEHVLANSETLFRLICANDNLQLVTSRTSHRFAGIVSFRHQYADNQQLFEYLNKNNVFCAFRNKSIRFSPHYYNTEDQLVDAMKIVSEFK